MNPLFILSLVAIIHLTAAGSCAQEKLALLIGNGAYEGDAELKNPINDVMRLEASLKALGFQVKTHMDVGKDDFEDRIVEFSKSIPPGAITLFYYAGHGCQVDGVNYMLPVKADFRAAFEVKRKAVDAGMILEALEEGGAAIKVLVLDCCRNNPFQRSWAGGSRSALGVGGGLAQMTGHGCIIAFATAPGQTAADGSGDNSPYTLAITSELDKRPTEGLELKKVFYGAGSAVKKATGQDPWTHMALPSGDVYLTKPSPGAGGGATPPQRSRCGHAAASSG